MSTLTEAESVDLFIEIAKGDTRHFAATPNAEIILQAQENPELKKYLQQSTLNFADAVAVLWAGEFLTKKWSKTRGILELLFLPFRKNSWSAFPEKITGSDSFEKICAKAELENITIALLGGGCGVATKTRDLLLKKFPKLKIVTAIDGIDRQEFWCSDVLKKCAGAQIFFIALGCPTQEFWTRDNLSKIKSARIGIGIGGTFDFYSGRLKRAPLWMQKIGFEWLYRLIQQPTRFKRIYTAIIKFPRVFFASLKK